MEVHYLAVLANVCLVFMGIVGFFLLNLRQHWELLLLNITDLYYNFESKGYLEEIYQSYLAISLLRFSLVLSESYRLLHFSLFIHKKT